MWTKDNEAKRWKSARMMRRLAPALALMTALSGCSLLPREEEPLNPPLVKPVKENFELFEVKTANIVKQVKGMATFSPSQARNYSFRESGGGRIKDVYVESGSVVKKGDVLLELETGDLELQVKQQELALEKAKIYLQRAVRNQEDDSSIRLQQIDVESATLQLDNLRSKLLKAKLVSDIDGIVTYVETLKQGDYVDAFHSLVSVSDPSKLRLVYEASNPSSLGGVVIEMAAEVKTMKQTLQGKVVQTPANAPITENKELNDRNQRTLIIQVDNLTEGVKVGTSADLAITTEHHENVLVIPRTGLRSYLGRKYVQVLDGESRKEVDVETGIETSTEIEISKGLKEGQKIILNN